MDTDVEEEFENKIDKARVQLKGAAIDILRRVILISAVVFWY